MRFAKPSPPSGWLGDFHPQAIEHARHATNPLRGNGDLPAVCRGARSSRSVTAEGQRLRRAGGQTARRRRLHGGGLEACVVRVPQSRMTRNEQRRSRLGEATPLRGVPLILRRLLNLGSQPRVQHVCATCWYGKHSQTRNSRNSKSVPYSYRLCEPQVANRPALPSFLRPWGVTALGRVRPVARLTRLCKPSPVRPAGSFFGDFRTPNGVRNSSRNRTSRFGVRNGNKQVITCMGFVSVKRISSVAFSSSGHLSAVVE